MRSTLAVYTAALCLLVGSASIAPPLDEKYAFSGSGDVCATLIEKVPCDGAGGAWTHVCKASVSVTCNGFIYMVETSRQLPDHVAAMVIPAEHTEASLGGWPLEQQHIVRPLGLSLGLGLLTLGRFLYNPCLFYLPAVLLGCTVIQQMSPYLRAEMGLSHHMITMVGALLGIVLACLQRHVVVWMFGALLGVLAFFGLIITTSYLNSMPIQLLMPISIAFGLAGSSIMLKLERTYVWKVLACAFVGSVLFTDAIGLSQLSCMVQYGEYCLVQYAICTVLVLLSCYHQVTAYRRAQKEREERERRLREAREEVTVSIHI